MPENSFTIYVILTMKLPHLKNPFSHKRHPSHPELHSHPEHHSHPEQRSARRTGSGSRLTAGMTKTLGMTKVAGMTKVKKAAVLFTVFTTILGVLFNPFASKIDAAWFNDNWLYRQKVAITNSSGSVQTDFQIMNTVDTATLITAGKIQADCDDIRFTDYNGKQLPYWIEPGTCNTSTTKIWTKVNSIAISSANILMYYGNTQAVSASSTRQTFIREISDVYGAWDLDEAGTGTRADNSGQGNTLTNNNGVTDTTGKFSNASQFTAASIQSLSRSDNASLSAGDTDFSFSGWIYLDSLSGSRYVLSKMSANTAAGIEYRLYVSSSTGRLTWGVSSGTTITEVAATTPTISTGGWYFITVWHNSVQDEIGVQVNNSSVFTASHSVGVQDSTATFYLGGITVPWDGRIDNFRLYKHALSSAERTDLYGSGGNNQGYTTTNYPGKELIRKFNTSVSVASPTSEEKAPSPVAAWAFDEGTGTTAKDSSPNGNHGTLTNGPTWVTEDQCISGKCLRFDGTDDYVSSGSDKSVDNLANGNFTVSAWINMTTHTANSSATTYKSRIASKRSTTGTNKQGWLFYVEDNKNLAFSTVDSSGADANYVSSANTIALNNWQYVTAVYTSSSKSLKLYVNGTEVNYITQTPGDGTSFDDSDNNLVIGGESDLGQTRFFNGKIDEPKIYPYARSAAQVKADFNARGDVKGANVILGSTATPGSTLSNGLVGYWKMDESSWNGTASEVVDASGNGNNGTAANGPTTAAGKFGNSGGFDGTDDKINISDSTSLNPGAQITMSSWIKPTSVGGYRRILAKSTSRDYVFMFNTDGKLLTQFSIANQAVYAGSTTTLTTNRWYHVSATYDGRAIRIYIDGVLDSTTLATGTIDNHGGVLNIGWDPASGSPFYGSIDETRIYNRALSPAEVSQLYNFAPGPVGYWNFEEGSENTINDTSGNGLTGTLAGTAAWTEGKVGKTVQLDGSNNVVTFTATNSMTVFTASAWIKTTSTGLMNVFSGGNDAAWYPSVQSGYVRWFDGNNWRSSTTYVADGQWHYATYVFNQGAYYIYVDGKLEYNNTAGNGTHTSGYFSRIGDISGGGRKFNGKIDEVRIYNYARTQKQIQEDMLAGGNVLAERARINSSGIVGYWDFDEGNGTTANNSGAGGNTLNGTLTNMAAPATSTSGWTNSGKMNKGLVFDGSNDYVTMGNQSQLTFTGPFAVSAWVKPNGTYTAGGTVNNPILSKYDDAVSQRGYALYFDGTGQLLFQTSSNCASGGTVTLSSGYTATANQWINVVGLFDGSKMYTYVNGKLYGTPASQSSICASTAQFAVGARYGSGTAIANFSGSIDEVKIYNYALTASEVRQDYNRGSTQVLGSTSTTAAGVNDSSSERAYCPPGDTTATCAPIAEWNFEEGSGSSLRDTSGNNNTGTITAGGTFAPGKFGKALRLDGTNNNVTAADNSSLNIGTNDFTLQGWVKAKAIDAGDCMFCKTNGGGSSSSYGFHWSIFGGSLYPTLHFGTSGSAHAQVQGQQTIGLNRWYHIAVVVDRDSTTNTKVYVDGKPVTTTVSNLASHTGSITNTVPLAFGRESDDDFDWNGDLDQIRMYNYARSPAQIAWDYNRGAPVAHWKFDECEGTTANDSSGNGNTGTVTIDGSGTQTSAGTCSTASSAWGNGASGKKNYSLNFDGTDDYVSLATDFTIGTGDFSLSAWYKTVVGGGGGIAGTFDGSLNGYILQKNAGKFRVYVNGSAIQGAKDITDGLWHHGILVRRNGVVYLYTDGKLEGQISQSGNVNTSSNFYIGKYVASSGIINYLVSGQIDEVKLFNYGLTSSQVKTLYTDGAVNFSPDTGAP